MNHPRRFLWALVFVSACLVTLCIVMAVSLFQQQADVARLHHRNVLRWKAATELEECFGDILALLRDRVESVAALHGRARGHLDEVRKLADHSDENHLADRLDAGFKSYLDQWHSMPPPGKVGHELAVKKASAILEGDLLKTCQQLEQHNGRRLSDATEAHQRGLRRLSWGIALVSGLGGVAGLVMGFGIARGLTQSIQRLQVQIRDAAGRLGESLPEIVVTGVGELGGLHEQVERLGSRIEAVMQQLQDREREVLRAEQLAAVGQLAAGVAHEIRNPLTSIKMLVQAGLEDGGSPGLSREDLSVIEQEVRRMEGSLKTFLDFARPPTVNRRRVELQSIIDAVLGLIRGRAEKQHVTVRLAAPAEPVILIADREQLQQVVVNLVLNALDAMPTGGVLTVTLQAMPGGGARLQVVDTGPGIAGALMPRLFQPFVSGKETGLGLGLVISRRIVEDHGGTLTAHNQAASGAMFVVQLPGDFNEEQLLGRFLPSAARRIT